MKAAEAGIQFPVLGFTPDGEIWAFPDLNRLTKCGPRTVKEDLQRDMELVGADGRRWRVLSVRRTGPGEPLLSPKTWLMRALTMTPQSRIEQELEPLAPLSLDETKARIRMSIEAFPTDWGQYEDGEDVLTGLLAEVDAADSVTALHERLGLDSFEAY